MHVHVHAVIVKNKDEQLESLKSIADTIAMMGRMPKVWFGKLERKKSRQTEETGHAQHHQPIISRRLSHYTNRDRRKRGAKEEIPNAVDRRADHVRVRRYRTQRRIGRGRNQDQGREEGRRMGHQRSEDVDHERRSGQLLLRSRANQSGSQVPDEQGKKTIQVKRSFYGRDRIGKLRKKLLPYVVGSD